MSSGKKILLAFECRQPQFSSSIRLGARADSRIVSKSEKKNEFHHPLLRSFNEGKHPKN